MEKINQVNLTVKLKLNLKVITSIFFNRKAKDGKFDKDAITADIKSRVTDDTV